VANFEAGRGLEAEFVIEKELVSQLENADSAPNGMRSPPGKALRMFSAPWKARTARADRED